MARSCPALSSQAVQLQSLPPHLPCHPASLRTLTTFCREHWSGAHTHGLQIPGSSRRMTAVCLHTLILASPFSCCCFFPSETVTKCLSCGEAPYVWLRQAVDLVLTRAGRMILWFEMRPRRCGLVYREEWKLAYREGSGWSEISELWLKITHHEVRNFAVGMEEKETYLVKTQRVWVGQLEVGVAEKPSESRNTRERRIKRPSIRRSIRECARWDGRDSLYRGIRSRSRNEDSLDICYVSRTSPNFIWFPLRTEMC